MGPHAAEIFYACGAVCKVSAPAREAGRREAEWSGAPYWWGIVGVVRPKSLMPTTPHGPQRLESFMLGVPSRQRSNLLCDYYLVCTWRDRRERSGPSGRDYSCVGPTRYGPAPRAAINTLLRRGPCECMSQGCIPFISVWIQPPPGPSLLWFLYA